MEMEMIGQQIAAHFSVNESALSFDEDQYFTFSNSCTVLVNGAPFDVIFDANLNLISSASAQ
jgi:hypothetical protein